MILIHDSNGAGYRIEEEEELTGPIFHLRIATPHVRSSFIGFADFLWEDENLGFLKLADIRINEAATIQFRKLSWLGILSSIRSEDRNCQRLGLGTQLLKHSLERLRARGAKRIVGNIKGHDFAKNPNLPKWYANLGFTVTMETTPSAVVGRISLFL